MPYIDSMRQNILKFFFCKNFRWGGDDLKSRRSLEVQTAEKLQIDGWKSLLLLRNCLKMKQLFGNFALWFWYEKAVFTIDTQIAYLGIETKKYLRYWRYMVKPFSTQNWCWLYRTTPSTLYNSDLAPNTSSYSKMWKKVLTGKLFISDEELMYDSWRYAERNSLM